MLNNFNNALVLITNSENQGFGSGFVVYKEKNNSYILTCSHVVEEVLTSLYVDRKLAEVIYQGSSDGLDLALLKADIDKEALFLMEGECNSLEIRGFKNFKNNDHILEPIKSTFDTKIEFRPRLGKPVSGWKFHIDKGDIIVGGYSGSPLICKETSKVVAVVSNRKGTQDGFAISIGHLKDIWLDMPRNLIDKRQIKKRKGFWMKKKYIVPIIVAIISGLFAIASVFLSNSGNNIFSGNRDVTYTGDMNITIE